MIKSKENIKENPKNKSNFKDLCKSSNRKANENMQEMSIKGHLKK